MEFRLCAVLLVKGRPSAAVTATAPGVPVPTQGNCRDNAPTVRQLRARPMWLSASGAWRKRALAPPPVQAKWSNAV